MEWPERNFYFIFISFVSFLLLFLELCSCPLDLSLPAETVEYKELFLPLSVIIGTFFKASSLHLMHRMVFWCKPLRLLTTKNALKSCLFVQLWTSAFRCVRQNPEFYLVFVFCLFLFYFIFVVFLCFFGGRVVVGFFFFFLVFFC